MIQLSKYNIIISYIKKKLLPAGMPRQRTKKKENNNNQQPKHSKLKNAFHCNYFPHSKGN